MNFIKHNKLISERHFPIQSSQEILFNLGDVINELNNSRQIECFTSFDIKSAFHNILLAKSDGLYTAFSFEPTQYISIFLPFGLRSSPTTWTELLDRLLDNLLQKYNEKFHFVDDLLIHATCEKT